LFRWVNAGSTSGGGTNGGFWCFRHQLLLRR